LPSETERKQTLAFVASWHDEPAWMVPADEAVERALPALIEQAAAIESSNPAEVLAALMTWAERRGMALPIGPALDFDVEILASWPRDLFHLAYRRCWENFAYRRMPEVADFKRAIADELAERQAHLTRLKALRMKMETARLRRQWDVEATEQRRRQRESERRRDQAALEKTASNPNSIEHRSRSLPESPNLVEVSNEQLSTAERHPEFPRQAPDLGCELAQQNRQDVGCARRAVPVAQKPIPVGGDRVHCVEPPKFKLGCPDKAPLEPGGVQIGARLVGQALTNCVLEQSWSKGQPEMAQSGWPVQEWASEGSCQHRVKDRPQLLLTEPDQGDICEKPVDGPRAGVEIQARSMEDPVVSLDHPDQARGLQVESNVDAVKKILDLDALVWGETHCITAGRMGVVRPEQVLDLGDQPKHDRFGGLHHWHRRILGIVFVPSKVSRSVSATHAASAALQNSPAFSVRVWRTRTRNRLVRCRCSARRSRSKTWRSPDPPTSDGTPADAVSRSDPSSRSIGT
jgi:hypothetical protein